MLATNTFSHTGAKGAVRQAIASPRQATVLTAVDLEGENIAITYGSNASLSAATVLSLENGLFKSPDHRQNLLNPT